MNFVDVIPLIVGYSLIAAIIGGINYGYVSATEKRKWKKAEDDGFYSGVLGVFWPVGLFVTLAWIVGGITAWTVTEVREPRKNKVRL